MMKTPLMRIFVKDIIDFAIVVMTTFALTLSVYLVLPSFSRIDWSFYFFEQNIEVFFVNPQLVLWLLGMSFVVTIIYFVFGNMLYQSTLGGKFMGITIVDITTNKPANMMQIVAMALGAYVGVIAFLVGPLSAWWLDEHTRGFAEKWSGTCLRRQTSN
jgi:uncharacterized RDD family membrane protein YckC